MQESVLAALPHKPLLIVGRTLERGQHWWRAARLYEAAIERRSYPLPDLNFRAAYCRYMTKKYNLALEHLNQAIKLDGSNAVWLHLQAMSFAKNGMHDRAIEPFERCIALEPGRAEWHIQYANSLIGSKNRKRAIRVLEIALLRWPENIEICDLLAKCLNADQGRWRELEVLRHGYSKKRHDAQWQTRLADSLLYLRRYEEAATHFELARTITPTSQDDWYWEGYARQLSGDREKANIAYSEVCRLDTKLKASELGIGAIHQARGHWQYAVRAYEETVKTHFLEPELHYRLGLGYEKLYNWDASQKSYEQAIALSPSKSHWHYRLGYVLERGGHYAQAADAYEWAATTGKDDIAFRWFRAGHASASAMDFVKATAFYYQSAQAYGYLEEDVPAVTGRQTDLEAEHPSVNYLSRFAPNSSMSIGLSLSTQLYEALGDSLLRKGNFSEAAASFSEAIFRREGTKYALHAKYGYALMKSNRHDEAARAFAQMRQFARSTGVDERIYTKGPQTRQNMIYTEFLQTLPVDEKLFFFESSHGSAIHCNPYAIFLELKNNPSFDSFRIVWVLNDTKRAPEEVLRSPNVLIVKQHSEGYLKYLATAKYLINNVTFPIYFSRRENQKYLNTWHGTPLKLMGKLVKGSHFDHKNVARNFLHATDLFLPNIHTRNSLINDHDLGGLTNAKVTIGGSPRIDRSLNLDAKRRLEILNFLGIAEETNKKIVLFAPTWRGQMSDHVFDTDALVRDLRVLSQGDHELVFRAHRFAEDAIKGHELGVRVVPPQIDTNELLAVVDILITDYSSIFYDFLPFGREIIFYTPDYQDYSASRGLYFERSSWPGQVFDSVDDASAYLSLVLSGSSRRDPSETQEMLQTFCPAEDGKAAARALDILFQESNYQGESIPNNSKIKLLFYQGSFMPNGIATSFSSLMKSLDPERYLVTIVIDSNSIDSGSHAYQKLKSLPDHVQIIARAGTVVQSPEQRWISDAFHTKGQFFSSEQHEIFRSAMKQEYYRMFGSTVFDHVINFEGYSRFWGAVLSNPASERTHTSVYLHNDMAGERDAKYPRMDAMFRIYDDYGKLVSVSKSVNEANAINLSLQYHIPLTKFVFANNLIDINEPTELAKDISVIRDIPESFKRGRLFVNMARLSPEKGHSKLLKAFSVIADEQMDANLIIMGDGPLMSKLRRESRELGLADRVLFLGQLSNPFPVLKIAECFVFSSEYEGQGLAMIEAMMLGLTVVSTDVVGSRSVVENGYGLLVENSAEGLLGGMRDFLSGIRPTQKFVATEYQSIALSQFESILT